jgi:hypothetical protein
MNSWVGSVMAVRGLQADHWLQVSAELDSRSCVVLREKLRGFATIK